MYFRFQKSESPISLKNKYSSERSRVWRWWWTRRAIGQDESALGEL